MKTKTSTVWNPHTGQRTEDRPWTLQVIIWKCPVMTCRFPIVTVSLKGAREAYVTHHRGVHLANDLTLERLKA